MQDLLQLGAATLGESGGRPLAPRMRPVWAAAAVAAPAFAVVCAAGDNLAVHAAVAEAPAGSVLCVEVEGQQQLGWWGEVLTTGAQARGIAGLVIDACVRDVDALERLQFPVFSIGIALPGAEGRPGPHRGRRGGGRCSHQHRRHRGRRPRRRGGHRRQHARRGAGGRRGQGGEGSGVLRAATRREDDRRAAPPRHLVDRPKSHYKTHCVF